MYGCVRLLTQILSDTDSTVPFENTTSINLINLLCVLLFCPFYQRQVWYWASLVYWELHRPISVCMCVWLLLSNHWTDLHKNYTSR